MQKPLPQPSCFQRSSFRSAIGKQVSHSSRLIGTSPQRQGSSPHPANCPARAHPAHKDCLRTQHVRTAFAPYGTSERSHCILTDRSTTVGYVPVPSILNIRAVGFAHGARLEQTFACPAVRVLLCQTFVPNVRHGMPARHDANALWLSVCAIRRTTSLGYYAVEPLRGSAGCTGVLVRRVRRCPRVQGTQMPHVLGAQESSCTGCAECASPSCAG